MRKLFYLILLVGLVGGGSYVLSQRESIESPQDLWSVVSNAFSGLTSHGGTNATLPPVNRKGETIHIASFNANVLGNTKLGKAHVMDVMARIVRQYDVVAIQEICSRDQGILPHFIDVVNATGRHYDYVIGPRLGRTATQEQYAFIFDTASLEVDRNQVYTVADPDDLFHREPLVAWFRVRGPNPEEAFTFSLVNLHIESQDAKDELALLTEVMTLIRDDGRNEDDVILVGDLSADDRRLESYYSYSSMQWAISYVPTNTRADGQYDNLLFQEPATVEFTGRSGVFDFFTEYNMTLQEALEVSDHLPVWAEFSIYEGGTPGRIAASTVEPDPDTEPAYR